MNSELNKRLLKLRNTNIAEFHFEMLLQKNFNQATQNLCSQDCGDMTGQNSAHDDCRVKAYKYRTAQAIQINNNNLSIPAKGNLVPEKSDKAKIKYTKFYKMFSEMLCKMPNTVWEGENPPSDCQKKLLIELDDFAFTDDVCDLS